MTQNNQIEMNTPQSSMLEDNPMLEDDLDIKKLLLNVLSNWYWFVLSLIITLAMAFLYNHYSVPIYNILFEYIDRTRKIE